MALLPPKFCPSCGVEYMHSAEFCSDCDVPLSLEPPSEVGPAGAGTLPPAAELALLLRDQPWELERTARMLESAGVRSRIDRVGAGSELGLFVLPTERNAALVLVDEYRAATLPDAEASSLGQTLSRCPACDTELAPGATSCTECGLEFPAATFTCERCGSEMSADDERCPGCGTSLGEPG